MNITITRRWRGWLACVDGVPGYSTTSGCEAIGNALVYRTPGVVINVRPPRKSLLRRAREIYWWVRKDQTHYHTDLLFGEEK